MYKAKRYQDELLSHQDYDDGGVGVVGNDEGSVTVAHYHQYYSQSWVGDDGGEQMTVRVCDGVSDGVSDNDVMCDEKLTMCLKMNLVVKDWR